LTTLLDYVSCVTAHCLLSAQHFSRNSQTANIGTNQSCPVSTLLGLDVSFGTAVALVMLLRTPRASQQPAVFNPEMSAPI